MDPFRSESERRSVPGETGSLDVAASRRTAEASRETSHPVERQAAPGRPTDYEHVRPAIPSVLDQVATGYLAPELITSRTAAWDDAIDALLEGTPSKFVLVRHEG